MWTYRKTQNWSIGMAIWSSFLLYSIPFESISVNYFRVSFIFFSASSFFFLSSSCILIYADLLFYVHFLWLQPSKSIRIRRQRFFFRWWLQSPCKTVFEFAKWELMKIQRTKEHRQTECERCDALRCFAANSAKTKGKCNKADDRFYFNDLTGLYKICNRFTISKNRCTWFGCFFFISLSPSLSISFCVVSVWVFPFSACKGCFFFRANAQCNKCKRSMFVWFNANSVKLKIFPMIYGLP